jgi:hypothetical protein
MPLAGRTPSKFRGFAGASSAPNAEAVRSIAPGSDPISRLGEWALMGRKIICPLRCGSWAEKSHGVWGSVSGRASGSAILANVAGIGFAASMYVRTKGDREAIAMQSFRLRPHHGDRCCKYFGRPA